MSDEKNTQRLHVTDDTQVIGEPGDTRRLPETTAAEGRPHDDPLPVFDEPRRDEPRWDGQVAPESPAASRPLVRTGPRTGTIVWGFLVVAVGIGLLAQAAGARIDVELATILLLGVAGALLVLGSLLSAARRRRDETRA
jgi:hypothetical protein